MKWINTGCLWFEWKYQKRASGQPSNITHENVFTFVSNNMKQEFVAYLGHKSVRKHKTHLIASIWM